MATRNERITPSRAIHPGEILKEELDARGVSQKEFASRIGVRASNLNEFIKGKRGLNEDWAIKFEEALGIPYKTWMSLYCEYVYDLMVLEERSAEVSLAMVFEEQCAALFNLREVYKRLNLHLLNTIERVKQLKGMFAFDLRNATELRYQVAGMYKHGVKTQIDDRNMLAWLLLNHIAISECERPKAVFAKGNATKAARELADMANGNTATIARIKECLSNYGIGYVEVAKLEKAPIDAFSTMSDGHYPVISVTYRYDDMDKLVYDILHELCHIDRHLSDDCRAFISVDDMDYSQDFRETEANDFARNMLIDDGLWKSIMRKGSRDLSPHKIVGVIAQEARKNGISQTVAVSRYKHDTGWYRTTAYRSPRLR